MSISGIFQSIKSFFVNAAKSPVVKQGEVVTVELLEAAIEAALDKVLGANSVADQGLDTILRDFVVKAVAKINAQ